ncbi:hypothetical protein D3C78_1483520 [compost metagenome]
MVPGDHRRILEGSAWGEPIGTVVQLVEVAIHDDETIADHVVLATARDRPLAGPETAIELFGRHLAVGTAGEATGIAITKGGRPYQGAASQQAEIRLHGVFQLDARLDVELLPVDFRAAILAAAHVHHAAAKVDVAGGHGCTTGR